jgi:small multidrug resistance pump
LTPFVVAVGVAFIALITVVGDYFLKLASQQTASPFLNRWFLCGFVVYALCAFGWVIAMQHMKLATIGVVYSVSTVLFLTLLGVFVFGETLNKYEMVGIACALMSIVLLSRFS